METSGPPPFILSFINSHTHIKKSSKQLNFCAAIDILSSATENSVLIKHNQQKNPALPPILKKMAKYLGLSKKKVLRCSKISRSTYFLS